MEYKVVIKIHKHLPRGAIIKDIEVNERDGIIEATAEVPERGDLRGARGRSKKRGKPIRGYIEK